MTGSADLILSHFFYRPAPGTTPGAAFVSGERNAALKTVRYYVILKKKALQV